MKRRVLRQEARSLKQRIVDRVMRSQSPKSTPSARVAELEERVADLERAIVALARKVGDDG